MASELRVNTLKDASGNNSIATSFVAGGSAKAWISFNGVGTPSVTDSLNCSIFADNGTGDYSISITSSFDNAGYSCTASNDGFDDASSRPVVSTPNTIATGSFKIFNVGTHSSDEYFDLDPTMATLHGDLA